MPASLVSNEAEYLGWLNASLAEVRGLVTHKPMTKAAVLRIKAVLDAQLAYNTQHMQRIKTVLDAQIAYNKQQMQTAS